MVNGAAEPNDLFIKEEDLIQPLSTSALPPASIGGNDGPSTMPMSPKGSELIKTTDFTSAKMQRLIISDQQALQSANATEDTPGAIKGDKTPV